MFSTEHPPSSKSERTRAAIRAAALRSFRERGYDGTTIRQLADDVGVSVGTTNYHFASKNELVQELYLQVQEQHRAAALPLLAASDDLVERVGIVYRAGLDQLTPYHPFASGFLSAAVSPKSPINPLSEDSAPALEIVEQLFRDAVAGARNGLPAEFDAALPHALVLGHLLLALYWVYDTSEEQVRTRRLLERGLALLRVGVPIARMPLVRRPLRDLFDLLGEVRA